MQKFAALMSLSLVAVLTLAPLAVATHSGCNGVITTVDAGAETLYVDDRSTEAGSINHWFYLESNDIDGLQSGGHNPVLPDEAVAFGFFDACEHAVVDTLIL